MTAITGAMHGEILPPGEGLTLAIIAHPLKLERELIPAPAGLSVAELVTFARARATTRLRFGFVVTVNGDRVPNNWWNCVRPKPGTVITIRAVPEGDGGNVLRAVLGIAAVAAGLLLAPVVAPWLVGLGIGLTTAAATSLAAAGITLAGQLAIAALFPVGSQQQTSNQASTTYSLSGGSNTANLYGVVPSNLGRNRVTLNLAAQSYTELVGQDQYEIVLLTAGYGPNDVSDIKIGETLLSDFDDVQTEVFEGYPTDGASTLYQGEVLEQDLSTELKNADGWHVLTTDANITAISVDVTAPNGIVVVNSDGSQGSYTVTVRAEYSPTGAGAWQLLGTLDFTARSTDLIRKGVKIAVPAGQYDVRLQKTTGDTTKTNVQDTVVWTALRGFRSGDTITFAKPLTLIAIRIRASSQLNGSLNQVNAVCQSKARSWDGAAWVDDTITRNPADLFRHVLQDAANARPVDDDHLDLDALQQWSEYCTAKGFNFDMVRDTAASVYDTLTDIAAAGRATQVFKDGKWSVVWDDETLPVVQHFSPRNSWGYGGAPAYAVLPHAFRVQFYNAANSYQLDERIVYDDGYNADGSGGLTAATLFELIQFPGVTDSDTAWKMGRFHIAQARLRPETHTLSVDFEHFVVTRGDRVKVTHDVPLWGLQSGRVKAVADNVVTLDEPVTMTADGLYTIGFRLKDGTALLRNVVTVAGTGFTVILDGPGDVPEGPGVSGGDGEMFQFGLAGAESVVLRVKSIAPGDDYSAKLTLVDDAPAISTADQGTIPPWSSGITVPADPYTLAPTNLTLREAFAGVGGDTASGVYLAWLVSAGEYPASFEVEYADDADGIWKDAGSAAGNARTLFIPDLVSGTWSFRVRAIFSDGSFSNWAPLSHQVLLGIADIPLADVTNLRTSYQDNTSALTWDEITDFRDVRYEIRKGDSWESALVLVGDQAHPPFATYGDGTYWIAAVARPIPGVITYSTNPVSLAIAGSVLVANVIATYDEAGSGWTGTVTGSGVITSGLFQTTAANDPAYYEIPASHVVDLGFARPARISVIWKATGQPADQNILTEANVLTDPDILGSASARFVDAWVEIAIAQSGSSDAFALPDAFAPSDIFAGGTTFADWQKFAPGVYVGQFFKFRLVIVSRDATVIASAVAFTVSVDVPDRNDHVTNHALAAGGETFTFTPDGSSTPTAFKGGPNGATVPHLQVTWNQTAGDQLVISGLSLSGVTLQILNGGVGVARTINAIFQGW